MSTTSLYRFASGYLQTVNACRLRSAAMDTQCPSYPSRLPSRAAAPRSLTTLLPLLVLLVAVLLVVQMWTLCRRGGLPSCQLDPGAKPRPIAPAGDLAADEKATIELFKQASQSVVHITTSEVGRDFALQRDGNRRGHRQRIHLGREGAHRHQLSRRRGRQSLQGDARRPEHLGRRARSARRPTRTWPCCEIDAPAEPLAAAAGRHIERPGGRAEGVRDRQSVRPRSNADDRRHQRPGAADQGAHRPRRSTA